MKPDLVGYVLGLLSEEERQEVEDHLTRSPHAREELAAVRAAVEPLAFDAGEPGASPGLLSATLQRIAAYRCRRQTPMPQTGSRTAARFAWRRADLLVAASIVFILCLLVPPALLYARHKQEIAECAANLHRYHNALSQYALQAGHNGYLPRPDRGGPFSSAAYTNIALQEAGLWDGSMQPVCPANRRGRVSAPMPSMDDIRKRCQDGCGLARLRAIYERLGGCYGYSLGYEDDRGEFVGVRRQPGDCMTMERIPIMSDRPPRERETAEWQVKNSPNHGGLGQNVLYLDGHVDFLKSRWIGTDDIFLNAARRVAAGHGPGDAVLAPGEARPYPEVE